MGGGGSISFSNVNISSEAVENDEDKKISRNIWRLFRTDDLTSKLRNFETIVTQSFREFMQENNEECLNLLREKIDQVIGEEKSIDVGLLLLITKELIYSFTNADQSPNISNARVRRFIEIVSNEMSSNSSCAVTEALDVMIYDIITLIVYTLSPKYLKSRQYDLYNHSRTPSLPDLEAADDSGTESLFDISTPDFLRKKLHLLDSFELSMMLSKQGSWLKPLFEASEALPLCLSISSARADRRGFPLIFINSKFEEATGYTRQDMIGRNCQVLQHRNPRDHKNINTGVMGVETCEKDIVEIMRSALSKGKAAKVFITNYQKDGTPFTNLIALKPIFTVGGQYRYVVGMQFKLSNAGTKMLMWQMAEELLSSLPSIIPSL